MPKEDLTRAEVERLKPYRVDWRYAPPNGFHAPQSFDTHEEAHAHAEEMVKQHGGEARIISQHVIARVGHAGKVASPAPKRRRG